MDASGEHSRDFDVCGLAWQLVDANRRRPAFRGGGHLHAQRLTRRAEHARIVGTHEHVRRSVGAKRQMHTGHND
jgi:hypothetical protein